MLQNTLKEKSSQVQALCKEQKEQHEKDIALIEYYKQQEVRLLRSQLLLKFARNTYDIQIDLSGACANLLNAILWLVDGVKILKLAISSYNRRGQSKTW